MEIEYSVEIEDLVAAGVASFENSKEARRSRRTEQISTAISAFLFLLILFFLTDEILYFILGIVLSVFILLFWPSMQLRSLKRKRARTFQEGSNRALLGRRVLQLEDDMIVERSELIWSKIKLEAIEQIIRSDSHTVLFLAPYSFMVIPHEKVSAGDLEPFVAQLREKIGSTVSE